MFLRNLYCVTEQGSHVFQTHPVRKQIDGEGITELMGVKFHASKFCQARKRTLPVIYTAFDITIPRPEEVFAGPKRACPVDFLDHRLWEWNVDRHLRLAV